MDSLANQEVLRWQMNMQKELGDTITHDNIKDFLWRTLKSGQVVPGYGSPATEAHVCTEMHSFAATVTAC